MNTSNRPGSFGICLFELRRRRNLSQKSMAILAGMDQSYLAGLEVGRRPPPKEKQLLRLIQALQATSIEEQELRVAHAISKLVDVIDELNPERGRALVALSLHLQNISLDDLKTAEFMHRC